MVGNVSERRSDLAFATPPHLIDPSDQVYVWFTDPPGLVLQRARPGTGTLVEAQWLANQGVAALDAQFPTEAGLITVMDLSLMRDRDPRARPVIVDMIKGLAPRIGRSVLIPPRETSPVYLASLKASAALLSLFGVHVEIFDDLASALAKTPLRPA